MRENRDRPAGTTPGRLVLERKPIEIEADLRSEHREVAADRRDTVGVLNGADVVAGLVAADRDRLVRDPRRLVREARNRRTLRVSRERVPAGATLDDPDSDDQTCDQPETDCESPHGREPRTRHGLVRTEVDVGGSSGGASETASQTSSSPSSTTTMSSGSRSNP